MSVVEDQLLVSVVATVAYCAVFHYPLTLTEISARLIRINQPGQRRRVARSTISKVRVSQAVSQLLNQSRLIQVGEYYCLPGLEKDVSVRRQRQEWSDIKWLEVDQFLKWVKYVPGVAAVAVTGSLAMNNAGRHDDVDFMIITAPHRLWLARLLVTLIALGHGKRRSWHGEEQNSWCFNLWLSQDHLAVPNINHSYYLAYEVIQARFVWECDARRLVSANFCRTNAWVAEYLWNWRPRRVQPQTATHLPGAANRVVPFLSSWLATIINQSMDGLDWCLFKVQYAYMKPHMTREKVGREWAFFHPRDTRQVIARQWLKWLKRNRPPENATYQSLLTQLL